MNNAFHEMVKKLSEFGPIISFQDNAFIIKLKYKKGWTVIEPENPEDIAHGKDKDGVYEIYVSDIEKSDKVFELIDATIEVNKEIEKKMKLYKEKVKELQNLFTSDIPYEKLTRLEFAFPLQKKTKKKTFKESVTTEEIDNTTMTCPESKETEVYETDNTQTVPSYIDEQISKAIGGNN